MILWRLPSTVNHCSLRVPLGRRVVGRVAVLNLTRSSSVVIEINYSGILHYGEGEDVEQVARTLITTSCGCDWLAFDLSNSFSLLFIAILHLFLLLLQYNLFKLSTHQECNCAPQLLFWEESREAEPFTGYTTSLLDCCSCL